MFRPRFRLAPIDLEAFRSEILAHFQVDQEDAEALDRIDAFWGAALEDLRGATRIEIETVESAADDDETPLGFIRATLPSGSLTHLALFRSLSEEELSAALLVGWTGTRLCLIVPEAGNLINPYTREALGRGGQDHLALATHIERHPALPPYHGDPEDYAQMFDHLHDHAPDIWSAYDMRAICAWVDATFGTRDAAPL